MLIKTFIILLQNITKLTETVDELWQDFVGGGVLFIGAPCMYMLRVD